MKIVSVNICGFKREGKFEWFRNLCNQSCADVVAVQETKCGIVGDDWIESLWGSGDFGYVQKEALERSGGLLFIWNINAFTVNCAVKKDYFLAIKGHWKGCEEECVIVNVYGPHNDEKKRDIWASLENIMEYEDVAWVLCGDFNEVRNIDERKNCIFHERRADNFNNFINKSNLIEIPLVGRRYTRISDDGIKFSKLDIFLVSEKFVNFGPKPIRVFDTLIDISGAKKVIEDAWSCGVEGTRPDSIFLKKLKNVKQALKTLSVNTYGSLESDINKLKNEVSEWEIKAECESLIEEDRNTWLNLRSQWIEKEAVKRKMLKQKARLKWIIDGNENNKFFHLIIKEESLRTTSGVLVLMGFGMKKRRLSNQRPSFESPLPCRLSSTEASSLEGPFTEVEVFDAIKDCGGSKARARTDSISNFSKNIGL
ncbi:uncharacterized protein [Rutidosis leptorrhynchoides]|uniref:uncharacterized protein n=1 Tax=Rutidosis leptorrhynchoides TaxID=125765 RepID=UPI003A98D3B0